MIFTRISHLTEMIQNSSNKVNTVDWSDGEGSKGWTRGPFP